LENEKNCYKQNLNLLIRSKEMITIDQATQTVLQNKISLQTESLPLSETIGKVLQEDLIADRDFPPYDRVTMDGIAINYQAFANEQKSFPIEAIAAAGAAQQTLQNPNNCLEVMTGAVMPKDADTVIRYEDVILENGHAKLADISPKQGQNIHGKGSDKTKGTVVVKAGKRISAAEIGVAATIGKTHLQVYKMPKAVIISTGDELVEIHETPLAHQIRKSNVHRIKAALNQKGVQADTMHLADDKQLIENKLGEVLNDYELVVLSGGVSKGKFDFIPEALQNLGVAKLFHKIRQRPGKPFWFGKAPTGAVVFALPGNPVSSFMCTIRFLEPWLDTCLDIPTINPYAILTEEVFFKPDLTYLLQVKIDYDESGKLLAHPTHGHGSGDLANLVQADGFLELPEGKNVYQKGEAYKLWRYR